MKKTLMACQVKEKKGQVKDRKKRGEVNAIHEKNRRCVCVWCGGGGGHHRRKAGGGLNMKS